MLLLRLTASISEQRATTCKSYSTGARECDVLRLPSVTRSNKLRTYGTRVFTVTYSLKFSCVHALTCYTRVSLSFRLIRAHSTIAASKSVLLAIVTAKSRRESTATESERYILRESQMRANPVYLEGYYRKVIFYI